MDISFFFKLDQRRASTLVAAKVGEEIMRGTTGWHKPYSIHRVIAKFKDGMPPMTMHDAVVIVCSGLKLDVIPVYLAKDHQHDGIAPTDKQLTLNMIIDELKLCTNQSDLGGLLRLWRLGLRVGTIIRVDKGRLPSERGQMLPITDGTMRYGIFRKNGALGKSRKILYINYGVEIERI